MKKIFLLITVLTISGCSVFSTLSDYIKENPLIASSSFRYATAQYIERGVDNAEKAKRKNQVIETSSKVMAFIDENPTITVSAAMQYLDAVIEWDKLDPIDRMLIQDILTIVEADLSQHETSNPLLNLREALGTILSAALLFGNYYAL